MAQTLEQLFKSKQLASLGGKTAAEAYDVQNSKDIRLSSADPLVSNTGIAAANLLRKTLGVRGSETLLEEEVVGVRIIRGLSTPVIYGNELGRLTLRTTPMLDAMKNATFGELSDGGLIGGKITKLRDDINSKLGIPTGATPTFVVSKLMAGGLVGTEMINLGLTQDRMNDLAAILKSAEGSLLGKLLKDGGGGNLKTIGKQALGSAIKLGKQLIRKKLFGDGERTGLKIKGTPLSNGSVTGFTQESADFFQIYTTNYGFDKNAIPSTTPIDKRLDAKGARYSDTIKPEADTPKERNDLSLKQQLDIEPIKFTDEPERMGKFSFKGGMIEYSKENNLETDARGFYTISDTINKEGVYTGTEKVLGNGKTLDEIDFVPLKFYSIHLGKTVQFRCTVTGLSESFSPSWDSYKFLGNPFNNYTYSGIERTVTFNFKVYSLDAIEHKVAWDKLNFLTGLVYPQGYDSDSTALIPPFIKFTLGDLFKNKEAFIESLSYTYDDNTPWNITKKETTYAQKVAASAGGAFGINAGSQPIDMKGYNLPTIVDVSTTIKFLESRGKTGGRKFFNFNPQTS